MCEIQLPDAHLLSLSRLRGRADGEVGGLASGISTFILTCSQFLLSVSS